MSLMLVFLSIFFNLRICAGPSTSADDSLKLSIIAETPFSGKGGYYFSHALTPMSKHEYIFVATPLKKGYFVIDGKKVVVDHTITVKDRKGLTIYFSGDKHNAKLTIKEEGKNAAGDPEYSGILAIQSGSENRKFKVHGQISH